eukprot:UN31101
MTLLPKNNNSSYDKPFERRKASRFGKRNFETLGKLPPRHPQRRRRLWSKDGPNNNSDQENNNSNLHTPHFSHTVARHHKDTPITKQTNEINKISNDRHNISSVHRRKTYSTPSSITNSENNRKPKQTSEPLVFIDHSAVIAEKPNSNVHGRDDKHNRPSHHRRSHTHFPHSKPPDNT